MQNKYMLKTENFRRIFSLTCLLFSFHPKWSTLLLRLSAKLLYQNETERIESLVKIVKTNLAFTTKRTFDFRLIFHDKVATAVRVEMFLADVFPNY